jgi:hypothetical protein
MKGFKFLYVHVPALDFQRKIWWKKPSKLQKRLFFAILGIREGESN